MKLLGSRTPYVGVTRFSVLNPKGTGLKLSAAHAEDRYKYEAELFNDQRLKDRLHLLGEVSAPTYQKMAEKYDYIHLVQYSPELPREYKNSLMKISKKFPVIQPVEVTDESMSDSVMKHVKTWDSAFRGTFAWFRVDDDDLLSVDFLPALDRYVRPENIGMAVSFPKVFTAQYASGRLTDFHQSYLPRHSIGQAYICYADLNLGQITSPEIFSHATVDKVMPLITDPTGVRAFHTRHAWQDSHSPDSKVGSRLAHTSKELGNLPFINMGRLEEKFPSLLVANDRNVPSHQFKFELVKDDWLEVEILFAEFLSEQILEFFWNLQFDGKPNEGSSLSLDFAFPELAEGHFPRDEERGDYRRLHVNQDGQGSMFVILPEGAKLKRVRLNADGGPKNVQSGQFSVSVINPL